MIVSLIAVALLALGVAFAALWHVHRYRGDTRYEIAKLARALTALTIYTEKHVKTMEAGFAAIDEYDAEDDEDSDDEWRAEHE